MPRLALSVIAIVIASDNHAESQDLQPIGSCYVSNDVRGFFVRGDSAYVVDYNNGGFFVVDISDRTNPFVVDSCVTPVYARRVYLSGNYAYVANGNSGIKIIDISDPSGPNIVSSYENVDWPRDIYVVGNYAYIADSQYGLRIIDVSEPSQPVSVSDYPMNGVFSGIFVEGGYAYMIHYGGLVIMDVSNPNEPDSIGGHVTPDAGYEIQVQSNYAYVSVDQYGLEIFNISNPQSPYPVAIFDIQGDVFHVFLYSNYAYCAGRIISISDPAMPDSTGSWSDGGKPFVAQDYIYSISNDSLWVYNNVSVDIVGTDISIPKTYDLLQNYPNPFNAKTTIKFSLSEAANVKLQIFDIAGRLVETLADCEFYAGENLVTWDAADRPSGVFFARLETPERSENIKLVLLK